MFTSDIIFIYKDNFPHVKCACVTCEVKKCRWENKSLDNVRKKNLLIGLLIKSPLQKCYMRTIF